MDTKPNHGVVWIIVIIAVVVIVAIVYMFFFSSRPASAPSSEITGTPTFALTAEQSAQKQAAIESITSQTPVTLSPSQSAAKAAIIAKLGGEQ